MTYKHVTRINYIFKIYRVLTTLLVNITNIKHIITIKLIRDLLFLYGLPEGTRFVVCILNKIYIIELQDILFLIMDFFIFLRNTFIKESHNLELATTTTLAK